MAKYRWPTDPPGKKPSHSVSWAQHQGNLNAQNQSQQTAAEQTATNQAAAQAYKGGQGAAPAPAAGTPPVAPPPPDWQQIAYETGQQRGVQFADAQATYDRGRIQRDFGYNTDGTIGNNPYAKANLLERNFQQQTRGTTNSMASQGQLYAGATQNAQNANTFNYLSDSNALKNQYSDALNQTSLNQLGAYSSAGSAISQEKINALLRALGQG